MRPLWHRGIKEPRHILFWIFVVLFFFLHYINFISKNSSLLPLKRCHWISSIPVINYRSDVQKDEIFNTFRKLNFWILTRPVRLATLAESAVPLRARSLKMAEQRAGTSSGHSTELWRTSGAQSLHVLHTLQKEPFPVPPVEHRVNKGNFFT